MARRLAELAVAEGGLHDRLAVVEGALDGEGMNVRRARGGHLPLLERRHPAFGEEDEEVDVVAPGEGLDRGAAGIAGGCSHRA